jgi:predicted CXXCH cytochrome family protein
MVKNKGWIVALVTLLVVGLFTVVVSVAQQFPPIPKGHLQLAPNASAERCFECHQTAGLPKPEASAFCQVCHINIHYKAVNDVLIAKLGPRPAHPIAADWSSADCFTCHKPHKTKIAKHNVVAQQPNSAFCQPCHQTPADKGISGKEKAGEFCYSCHSLGLSSTHVQPPGGAKTEFCYNCHKPAASK